MRSHLLNLFVTSRFFLKWCSRGVVSAFPLHETIDFTGFFGTFQDTAVADESYADHLSLLLHAPYPRAVKLRRLAILPGSHRAVSRFTAAPVLPLVRAVLSACPGRKGHRRADEVPKQRVRLVGPGFEFRVELDAHKPGVVRAAPPSPPAVRPGTGPTAAGPSL